MPPGIARRLKMSNKFTSLKLTKSQVIECDSIYLDSRDSIAALTVIVPHVNYGRFLPDSLNSIMNSTLKSLQIIVIDSGSDEVNRGIVREIDAKNSDRRITFMYTERNKLGVNRNKGAELATSTILCNFDPDDLVDPHYFELAAFIMLARKLNVIGSSAQMFGLENNIWKLPKIVTATDLNQRNCLPSHSLFTRETWKKAVDLSTLEKTKNMFTKIGGFGIEYR
jgi:glycosyltransferase involved in cell wall biosynthesis